MARHLTLLAMAQNVSAVLEPRGDGQYQITYESHGTCNGANTNLSPSVLSSNIVSVARPTLTSNGIAGMWWMGGVSDGGGGFYDAAQIVGLQTGGPEPSTTH